MLVALASLLLVAATLAGYAWRAVFNSEQFADRATATLRDPSVRTVVAQRVTDGLVLRNQPDLLAARPLIISAVSGLVGGGAFTSLFRRAALDAHRAVFARDEDTVTLTLVDVGTVAGAALQKLRPQLAAKLESSGRIVLVKQRIGGVTGDLVRIARELRILAYALAALTLVAAAAALAVSVDRRHTVSRLGLGMVAAAVVVILAYTLARAVVLGQVSDPDDRAAAGAVWSTFLGDLRTFGWLLAAAGAIVAAAAASLLKPVGIEGTLAAAWRVARTEPRATPLRLARAGGLIAAGVVVLLEPLVALQIVATLAGVYLLYKGVEAILRVVYRPPEPEAPAPPRRRHRLRLAAVAAIALLPIAGGFTAFAAGGGADAPADTISKCNGHASLCDRRLDQVVLPATHNSMSAPLAGWLSAEQERSIGGQLEDGIRGLLFDTHYADKLANGRFRTYFGSAAALREATKQDGVSDASVEAALRLRDRLGFKGSGTRGMYLCHSFCELGATPLATGLKDIHGFLVTHPDEIVVVINQDYVTPADFVKAIGDAGLSPYVFKGLDDSPWPTLRQMIEDGQRLVVLAENHAGGASWYQLAYRRLTEETPFTFPKASLLTAAANRDATCKANRGPAKAPLFLVNHWVSTDPVPRPSDAAKVNAYAPLLARARACQRVRDHVPNLLAVNFYKEGDVFRVVDTLNGT